MAARAELTVQEMGRQAPLVAPTQNAAVVADGHKFSNDGRTFLWLIGGTANCIITVQTPGTVDGLAIDDVAYDIPLGAANWAVMGPFPPSVYNQSDGMVYIDWEVALIAGVKACVVRIPA